MTLNDKINSRITRGTRRIAAAILLAVSALAFQIANGAVSLIPEPAQAVWRPGVFHLTAQTQIVASGTAATEAAMLATYLRPATGFPLPIVEKNAVPTNFVVLAVDPSLSATLGGEGYEMNVAPEAVHITAASTTGLFYGGQTLRQLLPPAVFSPTRQTGVDWDAPCCVITDVPRFGWRAYMLDYARHFFDEDYTKHLLDLMALHKMNILHMHLADNEGWRIEIKQYPKLVQIGAWRGTECKLANIKQETFSRYGGYFTQQQLREIVRYAAQRHIQVMPEIDLPGHELALCTAYPKMCAAGAPATSGTANSTRTAISPTREQNYRMISEIIGQLTAIFPFKYIDIGGDEVDDNIWKGAPEIEQLMKREKIGLDGVQTYFTKRLEKIIAAHDKRMIGWNEITNDKLDRTTGIMAWLDIGPGTHAAQMGFPVVMAPGGYTYFDMPYPHANDEPPSHWWAGPVDARKCYSLNPVDEKALKPDEQKNILGVEGCLWSEFILPWKSNSGWGDFKTIGETADFKTLPRLCALAEVAWTPQELRNFDDFNHRLGNGHLQRLANAGYGFQLTPPDAIAQADGIKVIPGIPGTGIRYTIDGTDPFNSPTAKVWNGETVECPPEKFRARAYLGSRVGPLCAAPHAASSK